MTAGAAVVGGEEVEGHRDEVEEEGGQARVLAVEEEVADQDVVEGEAADVDPEEFGLHDVALAALAAAGAGGLGGALQAVEDGEAGEGHKVDEGLGALLS